MLALIVGIIGGYLFHWNWTGLRQKTLWDWLQLLIIPAVLALAGYVINLTISRSEQEATKQRAKTEQGIAQDNQRETALQEYIDKMSELVFVNDIGDHPHIWGTDELMRYIPFCIVASLAISC